MKLIYERFKDLKVLVVGDIILDRYLWGTVDRISPEAPVPVVKLKTETLVPGGAANVAYNIKSLGGNPIIISLKGYISNDIFGYKLIKLLSEQDISNQFISSIDDWKTIVKTRVIAHNQQVVRIDEENNDKLNSKEITINMIKNINFAFKNYKTIKCVILSDYVKNTLNEKIIKEVIKKARKINIPIIVDSKRNNWSFFAGATIITPNINELEHITNRKEKEIMDFLDTLNIDHMLLTMGEQGMCLYNRKDLRNFHFLTTAKQVYDVTGAGDTVVATLALGLGAGMKLYDAITLANKAAGIVVGKFGTSTVTCEELESE